MILISFRSNVGVPVFFPVLPVLFRSYVLPKSYVFSKSYVLSRYYARAASSSRKYSPPSDRSFTSESA
jgi:hypothetical protein